VENEKQGKKERKKENKKRKYEIKPLVFTLYFFSK
jgi:hypothetical protein